MHIYLASDHAGFELKSKLFDLLGAQGYEVEDLGPHALDPQDDYPDFVIPLARRVSEEKGSFGIVIGGSGQGEAMAANRVAGARAAVCYGGARCEEIVRLSRVDNDANILSLGARFLEAEEAGRLVLTWLTTPFSGAQRHVRRIEELEQYGH